jgi:glycosyltransferase involved in cell wall biosynthesis
MQILIVLDHRFRRTPDGAIWAKTMFGPGYWQRYLMVFDSVRIFGRLQDVPAVDSSWMRIDSDRVGFAPMIHYDGMVDYAKKWSRIRKLLDQELRAAQAVILHLPNLLALRAASRLQRQGKPYAVSMVADPWDLFSPGSVRTRMRPLFRRYYRWRTARGCARAAAITYVTAAALQQRYPAGEGVAAHSASNIELQAVATGPRSLADGRQARRLIFVGALNQLYKGPDVLLRAFARAIRSEPGLTLTVVGEGQYRRELEALGHQLGIGGQVVFAGQLRQGSEVAAALDRADLFVLPSRQEGVPRAMIEAMSRGLPCIGTTVGGIPELLDPDAMVPPNEVEQLAQKIVDVVRRPEWLAAQSAQNLSRAGMFLNEHLDVRRRRFYLDVMRTVVPADSPLQTVAAL